MSAFISDTTLMTIVEVLRDIDEPSSDEASALEECLCGLEGSKYEGGIVLTLERYKDMKEELDRLRGIEMRYGQYLTDHMRDVTEEPKDHIPDATKKVETPEDAAEKWAAEYWDEEGNEYNELMQTCGVTGWIAGCEWAKKNMGEKWTDQ